MSMLSAQIKELRETAVSLGVNGVCTGDLSKLYVMLREAADTIEKLEPHSNQLEPSRWHQLFGTPERAARTISVTAKCFEPATACRNCMYKSYCDTECDYDVLLERLRGDA